MKKALQRFVLMALFAMLSTSYLFAVVTPESGKAYTLKSNGSNFSTNYYVYDSGTGYASTDASSATITDAYVWVCVAKGSGYCFVNYSTGRFMGFHDTSGTQIAPPSWQWSIGSGTTSDSKSLYGYASQSSGDRYLTIGSNGAFNRNSTTLNSSAYTTDFVFEEYTDVDAGTVAAIENMVALNSGSVYLIRTSNNYYLIDDGSKVNASPIPTTTTKPETNTQGWWTLTINDDGTYSFVNVSTGNSLNCYGSIFAAYTGTGAKYTPAPLGNTASGGIALSLNNWFMTFNASGTGVKATAESTKGDGSTTFSDFFFELVETYTMTISTIPATEATFTWNGETKTGTSATFTRAIVDGAVSDGSITVDCTDATECYSGATLSAASWDGTSNATITYTLTPNFFSTNFGDKWIRLALGQNNGYVMGLPTSTDYTGVIPKTKALDVSDESQLWCFVGTPSSFVIYNKAAGEDLALTYSSYGSGASYTTSLGTTKTAWMLDDTYLGYSTQPGYFIEPVNETTKYSLNSAGGAGGNIIFYNAGATNGGSRWIVSDASGEIALNCLVDGGTDIDDYRQKVGKVNVTYGSTTSAVELKKDNLNFNVYIPNNTTYSVSAGYNWYSYNFSGFTGSTSGTATASSPVSVTANYTLVNDKTRYLFYDNDEHSQTTGKMIPYRIPAIVQAVNGDLLAINDLRWRGHDIGLNYSGRYSQSIDIVARRSKDHGSTWESAQTLLAGDGVAESNSCAYGDAAAVADTLSNKILIMSATGYYSYANNSTTNHIRVARTWLNYDEQTDAWIVEGPTDVTDDIYGLFDSNSNAQLGLFFGSGRITQSNKVKVGDYYRLYAAALTRAKIFVFYSDDFGATWNILGDASTAASDGDEPKTVELPDGSVLLSVRKANGRYYNKYTYSATAISNGTYDDGEWDTYTATTGMTAANCNGEVLVLPVTRVADNKNMHILLQSVPAASGRNNVSIYYKPLEDATDYADAATIAVDWNNSNKLQLSTATSAYSTMVQMDNDTIAFYFEEMINASGLGYDMCYVPLSIEDITNNQFKPYVNTDRYIGDCNYDGEVNVTDVTMMINFILEGNPTSVSTYKYDYYAYNTNKDASEEIDVSDVTALVNIILSGTKELINRNTTNPSEQTIKTDEEGTGNAFSRKR